MDTLNEQTARDYVCNMMNAWGYDAVLCYEGRAKTMDGQAFINVTGDAIDSNMQIVRFSWDVWLENGKLYGEW